MLESKRPLGAAIFMGPLLKAFDEQFSAIHRFNMDLLALVDPSQLFHAFGPTGNALAPASFGEAILRSAATIEQTFGGLTTRMWDDPFEWTLPEKMFDHARIREYLEEVDALRLNGLGFFPKDDALLKSIPAPEETKPIFVVLLDTVKRAAHYQGRAAAFAQALTHSRIMPG